VTGLSILVYIFIETNKCIKIITLLWCSTDAPTCFGASASSSGRSHDPHKLLVGVHYRNNNGVSSEVAPINNLSLWMLVDIVNYCWKQWIVVEENPRPKDYCICCCFHSPKKMHGSKWKKKVYGFTIQHIWNKYRQIHSHITKSPLYQHYMSLQHVSGSAPNTF
jgi:hypothetical protein